MDQGCQLTRRDFTGVIHELLLLGSYLVRVDLVALRQFSHRRLLAQSLQGDLSASAPHQSRLLRHRALRPSNGEANFQLSLRC